LAGQPKNSTFPDSRLDRSIDDNITRSNRQLARRSSLSKLSPNTDRPTSPVSTATSRRPILLFAFRTLVARPEYSRHGRALIEAIRDRLPIFPDDSSQLSSIRTPDTHSSSRVVRLAAGNLRCRPTMRTFSIASDDIRPHPSTDTRSVDFRFSVDHHCSHI
jgi:hypothetical protein